MTYNLKYRTLLPQHAILGPSPVWQSVAGSFYAQTERQPTPAVYGPRGTDGVVKVR